MQNIQSYTQFVFFTSYMHMYFVLMRTVKILHEMVFFHFWISAYSTNTLPKDTFGFTGCLCLLALHFLLHSKQILESKFSNGKPGPLALSAPSRGPRECCAQEASRALPATSVYSNIARMLSACSTSHQKLLCSETSVLGCIDWAIIFFSLYNSGDTSCHHAEQLVLSFIPPLPHHHAPFRKIAETAFFLVKDGGKFKPRLLPCLNKNNALS